jgi:hypothetical protein
MEGDFFHNASGRESYEIFEAEPSYLKTLHQVLTQEFKLCREGRPIIGLDEVFCDYHREGVHLEVGWDCWTGCYMSANDEATDALMREIGVYLNDLFRHA